MRLKKRHYITVVAAAILSVAVALTLLAANESRRLDLTTEELLWLDRHAESIRIAPLPSSPPIDFVDEDGFHRGLTSDYIHLIERQLGIRFKVVRYDSWQEIIEKLKSREVDLVGSVQNTEDRRSFLHFTEPYLSIPNIVVARKNTTGRYAAHTLGHLSIAIVNRSATHDYMALHYPNYQIVPVKDAATGFQMVSFNEVDVMIADQGVASHYISKLGITNLKAAGDINYPWKLCLASRKDWPIFNRILDKAVKNITWAQQSRIQRRWITLSDTLIIPRDYYLRIIGIILLLTLISIGAIVVWNQMLRRKIFHRTRELGQAQQGHEEATHALGKSEARFRSLIESTTDMIWEMNPFGNYTYVSPHVIDILGYEPEQMVGQSALSFLTPADAAVNLEKLRRATKDSQLDCVINTHIHRNGNKVILESSGRAFCNDSGEFAGLRGVSRNITDRVDAEIALKASEERFRNLVETTSDWIWEVDTEGRFIYASPQVLNVLGYSPIELVGRRFTDQMISPDAPFAESQFQNALASGETIDSMTSTNRHKNGRLVVIEASAVPFYNKAWNIQGYRGISRDISARIAAERQLEFERDLFRSFMAHAPHLVSFKDTEGHYIEVNQAKADEVQLPPEELVGKTDFDYLPEEQARQIQSYELEVMKHEKPIQREELLNTPSGKRWYLTTKVPRYDEAGHVVGTFGTSWNITHRKQAENELRRLRALLTNIIDSMPSVLIGVNLKGCITQWNRGTEGITGILRNEAIGQPLETVFPQMTPHMPKVELAILSKRPQREERFPAPGEDNSMHYLDITVYPLLDDDTEGAVIRVDDITERVQLEKMMVQTEKMLSVGGLAAGMAHEINNPLAGILQNMQVMRNRSTETTEMNQQTANEAGTTIEAIHAYMQKRGLLDMMDSVTDAGKRAAKIVDNMLSFSRKDTAEYAPTNLIEIIDRSIELAANDYNLKKHFDFRHIRIERQYDETIGLVSCEKNQIQQVILNLLSNSAQAMAEHNDSNDPSITIRLIRESNLALVEIQDNGPGMDDLTKKRVFEPFFTTKEVGSGTGLGLSVSYFIITENHNGSMQVDSHPGQGTCFSIRIPIERDLTETGRIQD